MHTLDGLILRQAAVLAYNHAFVLVSVPFFIGFPPIFLLRRGHPGVKLESPVDQGADAE